MSTIQQYNPSVNVLRSVLWAFNEAVNLQGLLQAKQDWYTTNHVDFWTAWVRDVFDLRTATSFGLSVWSRVLDLPLFGTTPISPPDYPAFGFDNGVMGSPITNFFDAGVAGSVGGNFATDPEGAFGLSTEQQRILLRLRFFQLVTRATIPEINTFLVQVFGPDEIWAADNLNMTMRYVYIGATARDLQNLLETYDLLPRPAGVRIITEFADVQSFGFDPVGQNFFESSFRAP